ncbi:UNVERIFIED_CONTAM: hypothetical protein Sindi_0050000 [Sesamum indicum]
MSSGMSPVPRGRDRGRGPSLPPVSSHASRVREASHRPPTPPDTPAPSPALQTPDDAGSFGAARAADDQHYSNLAPRQLLYLKGHSEIRVDRPRNMQAKAIKINYINKNENSMKP